jgi:hypothetical protein
MTGYALKPEDFAYLVELASRHHLKLIAGSLGLTVQIRCSEVFLAFS